MLHGAQSYDVIPIIDTLKVLNKHVMAQRINATEIAKLGTLNISAETNSKFTIQIVGIKTTEYSINLFPKVINKHAS